MSISKKNLEVVYDWAVKNSHRNEIARMYEDICIAAGLLMNTHENLFTIVEAAYPHWTNSGHWEVVLKLEDKNMFAVIRYRDAIAKMILKIIARESGAP